MLSRVSRRPAVSVMFTGIPARSSLTLMASRVVPGVSETMAMSAPARAFSKVDLPALGGADDDEFQAVAQALGIGCGGEGRLHFGAQVFDAGEQVGFDLRGQVFVGEVD